MKNTNNLLKMVTKRLSLQIVIATGVYFNYVKESILYAC